MNSFSATYSGARRPTTRRNEPPRDPAEAASIRGVAHGLGLSESDGISPTRAVPQRIHLKSPHTGRGDWAAKRCSNRAGLHPRCARIPMSRGQNFADCFTGLEIGLPNTAAFRVTLVQPII